ncbi:hypothetical protein E3P96_01913 [Wallemia ichthyophaga]|nr:hypothetical protein E3P96_01913 [Wallemia ichthyophaga]
MSQSVQLPAKPKQFISRNQATVTSNLFPMRRFPKDAPPSIYVYDVTIEATKPKVRNWKDNLRAMRFFLANEVNYGSTCAYDGQSLLYSSQPLPFDSEISVWYLTRVIFNLPAESETPIVDKATGEKKGAVNKISLKPVSVISTDIANNSGVNELIAALNTVVRYCATMTHPSTKGIYYPINGRNQKMEFGANLLRSWFTTTRMSANGIILNVDTSVIKLLQDGPLDVVAGELMGMRGQINMTVGPKGRMNNNQRRMLEKKLKKVKVVTNHNKNRPMTFMVQEVSEKNADEFVFEGSDGVAISISEYLMKTYNLRLRYPELPVIGKSRSVFVPMELLNVLPGQIHPEKGMTSGQTSQMMNFCKVKPFQRLQESTDQVTSLSRHNHIMDKFGFEINPKPVECQASIIDPPQLEFDRRLLSPNPQEGEWDRPSQNMRFYAPAKIKSWMLICFGRQEDYRWLGGFLRGLRDMCSKRGMSVPYEPEVVFLRSENARFDEIMADLRHFWDRNPRMDFVLSTCKFEKSNAYRAIKHFCDITVGVPSQFLLSKKASSAKPTYISNLVLKINVKAGGINQTLGTPNPYFAHKDKVICFGVDVTHPAPGSSSAVSIAGIVSNTDQRCSKFVGSELALGAREEIIENLKNVIKRHVKTYSENNGNAIPRHVLYLRDGVSDGQYKEVLQHEKGAIMQAYREITGGRTPVLTFVVGQKRHHVRFAPLRNQPQDRSGNCRSGTIIDHPSVTRADQFEFYAYTHSGLMGTSRPCRYVVLHDDFGFDINTLGQTIYATCFTYQIATRAVSLATPVYYAHKLAERARLHLNDGQSMTESGSRGSGSSANIPGSGPTSLFEPHINIRNLPYFV